MSKVSHSVVLVDLLVAFDLFDTRLFSLHTLRALAVALILVPVPVPVLAQPLEQELAQPLEQALAQPLAQLLVQRQVPVLMAVPFSFYSGNGLQQRHQYLLTITKQHYRGWWDPTITA